MASNSPAALDVKVKHEEDDDDGNETDFENTQLAPMPKRAKTEDPAIKNEDDEYNQDTDDEERDRFLGLNGASVQEASVSAAGVNISKNAHESGNDGDDVGESDNSGNGSNSDDSNDSHDYDWEDPTWDHHFGQEQSSARDPYNNRGRTDSVWKSLMAYGFRKSPNNKSPFFDGPVPSPCFEYFVRENVKERSGIQQNGEIESHSIEKIANEIRTSHQVGYLDDEDKSNIQNMDNSSLVTQALSVGGFQNMDLYYSFCRQDLEQDTCTWHCRICKECKDWRDWHCKGCNRCQYGASIPCHKCNEREYRNRMGDML